MMLAAANLRAADVADLGPRQVGFDQRSQSQNSRESVYLYVIASTVGWD
jgi:hypothetical protein